MAFSHLGFFVFGKKKSKKHWKVDLYCTKLQSVINLWNLLTVFRIKQNLPVKLHSASYWAQVNFRPNMNGLDLIWVPFMYLISPSLNSSKLTCTNKYKWNPSIQAYLYWRENVIVSENKSFLVLILIGDVSWYLPWHINLRILQNDPENNYSGIL